MLPIFIVAMFLAMSLSPKPGDNYAGEFISGSGNGDTVVINTTPCAPNPTTVSIPHGRITNSSQEACPGASGRKYKKVQVEEEAAPEPPKPKAKDAAQPNKAPDSPTGPTKH